jgi:hypothetical protein
MGVRSGYYNALTRDAGPNRAVRLALWRVIRKGDVTAAGRYAAIACEPGPVHFQGSSSSIFVFG